MAPSSVRALHFVLKVADRTATVAFLHDVLVMHALRHEEFKEGCRAACNGPYDGMWSKTMMGYADEVGAVCLFVWVPEWHGMCKLPAPAVASHTPMLP